MSQPKFALSCGTILIGLALSGCAHNPMGPQALQVKPNYQVKQGGQVDLSYGYIVRAREAEAENQLEHAAIWWARAVGAAPGRADAHHGLGLCLARMGRLPEGIGSLREAASLAPHDARILNNLGNALKLQGERDEAVAMFKAALQADPTHAQARYNLAMLAESAMSMTMAQAEPREATSQAAPVAEPTLSGVTQMALRLTTVLGVQQAPNVAPLPQITTTASAEPLPLKGADNIKVVPLTSVALNDQAVPASTMSVTLTGLTVEVFNGNGIAGAAKGLSHALARQGLKPNRIANMAKFDVSNTRIVYRPGKAAEARALARLLPTSSELEEASASQQDGMRADVRVVLGRNLSQVAAACLSRGECVGSPAIQVASLD